MKTRWSLAGRLEGPAWRYRWSGRRWSCLDASWRAGFGSYPQFHRVFKRLMGCTPAAYRRRLREG